MAANYYNEHCRHSDDDSDVAPITMKTVEVLEVLSKILIESKTTVVTTAVKTFDKSSPSLLTLLTF